MKHIFSVLLVCALMLCAFALAETIEVRTLDEFLEALKSETDRDIRIVADITLDAAPEIPEDFNIVVAAVLTLEDGVSINGNITPDAGDSEEYIVGYDLKGTASVNGYANNPKWSVRKTFLWNCKDELSGSEYDAEGTLTFKEITNTKNERLYFYLLFEPGSYLEVWYYNYVYNDDGTWQYDYETTVVGEHRVGTECFRGTGDDMIYVFNRYDIDDGGHFEEEYDENGELVSKEKTYRDEQGNIVNQEKTNANGEMTYRFLSFGPDSYLEVYYSNYVYHDDGVWQYDYDAMVAGEHRVGTEGFTGTGDDMVCVFNEFKLDDGTREREDWYNENEYFFSRYAPDGTLSVCGTCETFGTPILTWEINDDEMLILPEDTVTIGKEAFENVSAKVVKLGENVKTIEEDAFDEDMLLIVPAGSEIIQTIKAMELFYTTY